MSSNKQVVLVKRPVGAIVKGESFRIEDKPRLGESDLEDGQVLLETIYLSLDPALRGMLMGKPEVPEAQELPPSGPQAMLDPQSRTRGLLRGEETSAKCSSRYTLLRPAGASRRSHGGRDDLQSGRLEIGQV